MNSIFTKILYYILVYSHILVYDVRNLEVSSNEL
jgi:hypothetical protein